MESCSNQKSINQVIVQKVKGGRQAGSRSGQADWSGRRAQCQGRQNKSEPGELENRD